MERQAAGSSVGPCYVAQETPWFVPCGGILVLLTVFTYGWLATDVLLSRRVLCELETNYVIILGAAGGVGVGLLVAAGFDQATKQIAGFLGSAAVAGVAWAALVIWIFSSQCASPRMFVRQLVGL